MSEEKKSGDKEDNTLVEMTGCLVILLVKLIGLAILCFCLGFGAAVGWKVVSAVFSWFAADPLIVPEVEAP